MEHDRSARPASPSPTRGDAERRRRRPAQVWIVNDADSATYRPPKGKDRATEPREIVQAAIEAYHDHDLARCMGFYAPDVVVMRHDGTVVSGAEAVRAGYAKAMADHPNLRYDIPNRIALGQYVVDEERVTGYSPGGPDVVRAILVYRFDRDLIAEIRILVVDGN